MTSSGDARPLSQLQIEMATADRYDAILDEQIAQEAVETHARHAAEAAESTFCKEWQKNGSREDYDAWAALPLPVRGRFFD